MGAPKMVLRLGDRTLLEHSLVNHLGSSLRRVCTVLPGWIRDFDPLVDRYAGDRADFLRLDEEVVMSASLRAGWARIEARWRPDAVMISLADMPLVTPDIIDAVIDGYAGSGCDICVPVFRGERGHPVILNAGLDAEVRGLSGDRGARGLIDTHGGICEIDMDTDAILFDVDTPDDFEELLSRLRETGS